MWNLYDPITDNGTRTTEHGVIIGLARRGRASSIPSTAEQLFFTLRSVSKRNGQVRDSSAALMQRSPADQP